jgi:hypothetical protein
MATLVYGRFGLRVVKCHILGTSTLIPIQRRLLLWTMGRTLSGTVSLLTINTL